jgi:hypothetical protein
MAVVGFILVMLCLAGFCFAPGNANAIPALISGGLGVLFLIAAAIDGVV